MELCVCVVQMGDEWRLQENVLSRPTQAGPLLEHGQYALWQAEPLICLGNLPFSTSLTCGVRREQRACWPIMGNSTNEVQKASVLKVGPRGNTFSGCLVALGHLSLLCRRSLHSSRVHATGRLQQFTHARNFSVLAHRVAIPVLIIGAGLLLFLFGCFCLRIV
jgi:hypothetical protein